MKFIALSLLLLAGSAQAVDRIVTSNLNSGPGTLRTVIAAASNGDRIVFDPSLAGQTIALTSGSISLGRSLTIDGSGLPSAVILSGNKNSSIFSVSTTTTLDSLVLRDGKGYYGGAINSSAQLTVRRCAFLQNQASYGGAIYHASSSQLLLQNSTFTANTSEQDGGAISCYGTMELRNCTIVGNIAGGGARVGSGIYALQTFTCRESVIAGNGVVNGAALPSANVYPSNYLSPTGASAGNFIGIDPVLSPLGSYGGPTPTMLPLSGSPLVDPAANSSTSPLATDQRGSIRVTGPRVDTGAVEWNSASAFVSPPNGFASASLGSQAAMWSTGQVGDSFEVFLGTVSGQLVKMGATAVGRFNLPLAQSGTTYYWRIDTIRGAARITGEERSLVTRNSITVTTLADENNGGPDPALGTGTSLREAILAANVAEGGDRIEFAAALSAGTVLLGGTQLSAAGSLEINAGNLGDGLTISADRRSRVLSLAAESTETPQFVLTNLKLTDGKISSGSGAGISAGGKLVLDRCEISRNEAGSSVGVSGMTVEMRDSSIHSNIATGSSNFLNAVDLVMRNSAVAGNLGPVVSAAVSIVNSGTLENSTVSDNAGRGISKSGSGALVLRHVTVTRNHQNSGAAGLNVAGGSASVENSIIAGNFSSATTPNVGGTVVYSGVNVTSGDPLLAPLGNYGGSSKSAPPAAGSPAINPPGGATSSTLATDQRGYPRIQSGMVDAGAVEFGTGLTAAPAEGATGISNYNPVLYWPGPAATSYSVYLGMAPGALVPVATTGVGLWSLGILEPGTTYYWRVDATTGGGTVTGTVLSFTTSPALQVTTLADENDGTMDPSSGSGSSLREVLAAAVNTLGGDTIRFAPGLAGGRLTLVGTALELPDRVLIDALPLPGGLTISANRLSGVLHLPKAAEARLQGLVLRDGNLAAGVLNEGTLAMQRCTVTENVNTGITCYSASLTMDECLICRNNAFSHSGIDSSGSVLLRRCTISGNRSYFASAIEHQDGPLTLEQCTVSGNQVDSFGWIVRCVSGNLVLRQSTFFADAAGASTYVIDVSGGSLTLENSIVAGPGLTRSQIRADALVELGTNLITGDDPLLAPLGNYGGPTPTMPPVAGSPTIDPVGAATTSGLGTDQRGSLRLSGPRVDTGAVEYAAERALSPSDGAGGVANYRLALCWPGVAGAASYQVFLAPEGSSLVAAGNTSASIWTTGQLEPGTSYHWRVDAVVDGSVVNGPEWSFTTRPALMVTTLADENDPPSAPGSGQSLREAVDAAATTLGGDVIRFAPGLDGGTLRLGGEELLLYGVCAIDASTLPHGIVISGDHRSGVFEVPFDGDVAITTCTIRDGSGTGMRNLGHLSMARCSVVHNRGGDYGGGIYNRGDLRLANSTIAENRADNGGGIYNEGFMELRSTTVSANHARTYGGSGIKDYRGGHRLISSIVAGNRQDKNISGTTGSLEGVNFLVGDPHLASLGNYGGPTPTMPPLAGSPVIDPAGSSAQSSLATDQRGQPRIAGSLLDSGAVEWSADPFWSPADGTTGLSVPRVTLNWNAQPGQQSHQVLLGAAPDHLVPVGSTAWGSFTLGGLEPAKTYYWRIDSSSGGNSTQGEVRHFTTRAALIVTTAQDETDPSPASGTSLTEALVAAAQSEGGDWIGFAPELSGATITLQSYRSATIDSDVTIDARSLALPPMLAGEDDLGVVEVKPLVTARLAGFRVTRSHPYYGAGINCEDCDVFLDGMEVFGTTSTAITAVDCNLHIENSTVHHNVGFFGGGLDALRGGLEIVNSTFAGNTAELGGGLYLSSIPAASLRHVTISGNSAHGGGGIAGGSGGMSLHASILAGNTDTEGFPDGSISQSIVSSSLVGGTPCLAPLGLYGGRVPIMPLLPGSPAIDLVPGASANPPLDQRGATRPVGPSADAGAVEAFPFVSLPKIDTDSDGIDDRLEPALGFVVGQNDSAADRDGDGRSDAAELDAMTDPTDPKDFLHITSFQGGTSGWMIHFRSFPGLEYRLARSADLSNFTPVIGTKIIATGRSSSMAAPNDAHRAMFRVEVSTSAAP